MRARAFVENIARALIPSILITLNQQTEKFFFALDCFQLDALYSNASSTLANLQGLWLVEQIDDFVVVDLEKKSAKAESETLDGFDLREHFANC